MALFRILLSLSISLWLGGLVALFIFAQNLFAVFPRGTSNVAMQAAPQLFLVFERYQLVLATVALICASVLAYRIGGRVIVAMLVLVMLSTIPAVVSATLVTPKMEALRAQGLSADPHFKRLHGRSMMLYSAGTLLVAGAAALVPFMPSSRRVSETGRE
jgi:hypothetical protein